VVKFSQTEFQQNLRNCL